MKPLSLTRKLGANSVSNRWISLGVTVDLVESRGAAVDLVDRYMQFLQSGHHSFHYGDKHLRFLEILLSKSVRPAVDSSY